MRRPGSTPLCCGPGRDRVVGAGGRPTAISLPPSRALARARRTGRAVGPPSAGARRAFTLVEALIAVGLVALATTSIMAMLSFDVLHNNLEQERARAHQIVCEKMEQIENKLYTRMLYDPDIQPTETVIWDNGTPDDPSDDTDGVLEVVVLDPDGNPASVPIDAYEDRRLQIEVTLTWHPRGRLSGKTYHETVMGYKVP
ncbi:MAG: hypothetical protein M1457_06975 [bacterium]|nr:hypothetical protein [bacterium]